MTVRYLEGDERKKAQHWLDDAVQEALKSRCEKSKRGVIIVKNNFVLGRGCNNPPADMPCVPDVCKPVCGRYCVHAEQNAIIDALNKGFYLKDSQMYHVRMKEGVVVDSREPCCIDCSKLVLQLGIAEFVMKTEVGMCAYGAQEFHDASLAYVLRNLVDRNS